MPVDSKGRFNFDGYDKATRARWAENFGRTHYFIQGMLLSGRRNELIPYFQAFFDFCRGRTFTPDAKLFADYMFGTARLLDIRDRATRVQAPFASQKEPDPRRKS